MNDTQSKQSLTFGCNLRLKHLRIQTNLKSWLKNQSTDKRKDYCENILKKRIEEGKSFLSPTQVELRSIMSPPVQYYQSLFGDYKELCRNLGYENRFSCYPLEGMLRRMITLMRMRPIRQMRLQMRLLR